MALFGNTSETSLNSSHALDDMNMDCYLSNYAPSSSKEIPPPDPLEIRNGIYIPPEETRHNQLSVEEVMGWALSDDQNDSEDDMDDNVFDMDFDDVDLPPPLKPDNTFPVLCQRHLNQPQFDTQSYRRYVPPQPFSPSYSAFMHRNDQAGLYKKEDSPPFQYINPSTLQLRRTPNYPGSHDYSGRHAPAVASTSGDVGLSMDDLDVEMGLDVPDFGDDIYPIIDDPKSSTGLSAAPAPKPESHHDIDMTMTAGGMGMPPMPRPPHMMTDRINDRIDDRIDDRMHPSMDTSMDTSSMEAAVDAGMDSTHFSADRSRDARMEPGPNMSPLAPNGVDHALTAPLNGFGDSVHDRLDRSRLLHGASGGGGGGIVSTPSARDASIMRPLMDADGALRPTSSAGHVPHPHELRVSASASSSIETRKSMSPAAASDRDSPVVELSGMSTPPPESPLSKARSKVPAAAIHSSPPSADKRKKAARRRVARSGSATSTTHVCNLTFSDGSECRRSFTRPYDLARHQETIHAPVRKMYYCEYCGEDSKTFSRLDALSRHKRLKHTG